MPSPQITLREARTDDCTEIADLVSAARRSNALEQVHLSTAQGGKEAVLEARLKALEQESRLLETSPTSGLPTRVRFVAVIATAHSNDAHRCEKIVGSIAFSLHLNGTSEEEFKAQLALEWHCPAYNQIYRQTTEADFRHLKNRPHIYVDDLNVHPDYQRRGFGHALFTHAHAKVEELMKVHKFEDVLPYYLEASDEGLRLYKKLGFVILGKEEIDLGRFVPGKPVYPNYQMIKLGTRL